MTTTTQPYWIMNLEYSHQSCGGCPGGACYLHEPDADLENPPAGRARCMTAYDNDPWEGHDNEYWAILKTYDEDKEISWEERHEDERRFLEENPCHYL